MTDKNRGELFDKFVFFLIILYFNIFRYAMCLKTDAGIIREHAKQHPARKMHPANCLRAVPTFTLSVLFGLLRLARTQQV